MIFFDKTKPDRTKSNFVLQANFDGINESSAKSLQNVSVCGKLTTKKAFAKVSDDATYNACNYIADYVAVTSDGICYNDGTGNKTVMTEFADDSDAELFFHAESGQLFATSATNGVYRFDGSSDEKIFDKRLYGLTAAGYRICGFNGNTVYFSDVYASDFSDDEDGGRIVFDRPVSGIAAIDNTLRVFAGDLYSVVFSADQKNISVKTVAKNIDNVTKSPCACGGALYFVGRHGLYKLLNNTVRRIADDSLFCNVTVAHTVLFDGKLAAYASGESDDAGKIWFADVHTDKIVGCVKQNCDCLFDSFGQLYAVSDNKLLSQSKGDGGSWTGKASDLGSSAVKYVRQVRVKASGKVTVRVKTDKMSATVTADGKGKTRCLPVLAFGNTIELSATLADGATVYELAAEGYLYGGETKL